MHFVAHLLGINLIVRSSRSFFSFLRGIFREGVTKKRQENVQVEELNPLPPANYPCVLGQDQDNNVLV